MGPIVGIGELLWDIYPDGRKVAGGAPFNFAFHCHQLGHEAVIVSRVGNDELGKELREEVRRLGMSDEFVQTDEEFPTGTVSVTVDGKGQPTYEIEDAVAWDHIETPSQLASANYDIAAICYGTLSQRSQNSQTAIRNLLNRCMSAIRVLDVNLRPIAIDFIEIVRECMPLTNWMKLNEDELSMLTLNSCIDIDLSYKQSPIHCLYELMGVVDIGILTRGSKSTAITDWQRTEWIPAAPATVIDTVGAGDAFTAAMVVMHLEGRPLRECARFANHYAARVCEHRGATPKIDRREVELAAFGRR